MNNFLMHNSWFNLEREREKASYGGVRNAITAENADN